MTPDTIKAEVGDLAVTDAIRILYDRFVKGDPEAEARVEKYHAEYEVAQAIYDLRTAAGLTQAQLAEKIGSSASSISRLEDADYEGHSLSMLRKIARAMGKKIVFRFVDDEGREDGEVQDGGETR